MRLCILNVYWQWDTAWIIRYSILLDENEYRNNDKISSFICHESTFLMGQTIFFCHSFYMIVLPGNTDLEFLVRYLCLFFRYQYRPAMIDFLRYVITKFRGNCKSVKNEYNNRNKKNKIKLSKRLMKKVIEFYSHLRKLWSRKTKKS